MKYLQNDTITLRALEPEDLEYMYKWENDTTLWSVSNNVEPYSKYMLREYINYSQNTIYDKLQLRLIIEVKKTETNDSAVVGAIDLFDFDIHHKRAGVGIVIDEDYRQYGYGGQALELLAKYAFGHLQLNQLYVHIPTDNKASIALFASQGFCSSGILKEWVHTGEGFADVEVMQLRNSGK